MTGPHASVIGMRVESAIQRFLTQRAHGHDVATGDVRLCGVIVEVMMKAAGRLRSSGCSCHGVKTGPQCFDLGRAAR